MICCGLERDSQFCPKCGKKLVELPAVKRWAKAERSTDGVLITVYPDRHRIPAMRAIGPGEAELLLNELRAILQTGTDQACQDQTLP